MAGEMIGLSVVRDMVAGLLAHALEYRLINTSTSYWQVSAVTAPADYTNYPATGSEWASDPLSWNIVMYPLNTGGDVTYNARVGPGPNWVLDLTNIDTMLHVLIDFEEGRDAFRRMQKGQFSIADAHLFLLQGQP